MIMHVDSVKNSSKYYSGQVVAFILILLASAMGLAAAAFSLMGYQIAMVGIEVNNERALQLAEAGANRALHELNLNSAWTGVSETTFGSGSYEVLVTGFGNSRTVQSTGFVPSKLNPIASRTIRMMISDSPGADAFRYGVQSGAGGMDLNSHSRVHGSAFSNGNITCDAHSYITGDGNTVGAVSPAGCVRGVIRQGVAAQPLPTFDSGYWQRAANQNPSPGCPATGDLSFSSGITMIGPCRVNGSLTLNDNAHLFLTGPIYVTGNFSMNSHSQLSIVDQFGTNGTVLLADGTISINSHSRINRVHQTAILRPNGDHSVLWAVTPGGAHWSAIDDEVTEPASADITDNIRSSVHGQANELNMTTVPGIATTTEIVIWAYARNTAAVDGDRLGINIVVDGAARTQQNISLGTAWRWVRATFTVPTGQSGVDGLRVRLVQNRQGTQDAVEVAAMYAVVRYAVSGGGHIMLVSSSTSTEAISLNSHARGGIFYALNGTVVVNSHSHPVALTGQRIILNSHAEIFYDQGLPDQSFTSGPGGGWVIRRGTWRIVPM